MGVGFGTDAGTGFKVSYCSAGGMAFDELFLGFRRSYRSGFAELAELVCPIGMNVDGIGLGLTDLGGLVSIPDSVPTPEATAYGLGPRANTAPCTLGICGIFGEPSP